MLQLLATTDPAPIAAWMLLLLGLGMYPVGLLMPCSKCCKRECAECERHSGPGTYYGTPPNTLTVTFPEEWPSPLMGEYRHNIRIFNTPVDNFAYVAPYTSATARVTATDVNGAITAVEMLHSRNVYARVVGGVVEVSDLVVSIENNSTGACAAVLTPVVEDDPNDPDFGKIISITITDGGCDYNYREEETVSDCCADVFGGRTFVLRRNPQNNCEFLYEKCEGFGWTSLSISLNTLDPLPVVLHTQSGDECHTHWTSTAPIVNCEGWSLTLEAGDAEATITMEEGGAYHTVQPCGLASCLDNCYTEDECPPPVESEGAGACRLEGPGGSYALCNESRKLSVTMSGVVDDPDAWSGGGIEGVPPVLGAEPDGGAIAAALNNTFVFPSGQYISAVNANGEAISLYVDCWQHDDHGEFVLDLGNNVTITLEATSDWNTFSDGVRVIGVTVEVLYREDSNMAPFYAEQWTRSQTVAFSDTPAVVAANPCGCKEFYNCARSGSAAMANGPETTSDPAHFWRQGRFVDFSNATLSISLS